MYPDMMDYEFINYPKNSLAVKQQFIIMIFSNEIIKLVNDFSKNKQNAGKYAHTHDELLETIESSINTAMPFDQIMICDGWKLSDWRDNEHQLKFLARYSFETNDYEYEKDFFWRLAT